MAVNYDAHFQMPPWDLDASRFHLLTGKPREQESKHAKAPSRTRPGWPATGTPKRDYALLRQPRPPEPKVPWWGLTCLLYTVPIVAVIVVVALLEIARG